ncbi:MAG: PstC family ABC transporter permease [Opitutales bacterium]
MKRKQKSLVMAESSKVFQNIFNNLGQVLLFVITAVPTIAVVFILFFIAKEAMPFFASMSSVVEFFTSSNWTPSVEENPSFGALSIFYGTAMVTLGACVIAVPLSILAAVCLNEIIAKTHSQVFKPIIELLAAIPSVAYGFFAMVILAPLLQDNGNYILSVVSLGVGVFASFVLALLIGELLSYRYFPKATARVRGVFKFIIFAIFFVVAAKFSYDLLGVKVLSGTNALNASVILAIMALPTIVSISQDALLSVGREMREGSLALGATRAETIFKVIIPCAKNGIMVAVILGFMRVLGETMVVWMASGNSLKIPEPFYNFLEPVRTLTATVASEMGEADQSTGSMRYHVLFAMSLCLLIACLGLNAASHFVSNRKGK